MEAHEEQGRTLQRQRLAAEIMKNAPALEWANNEQIIDWYISVQFNDYKEGLLKYQQLESDVKPTLSDLLRQAVHYKATGSAGNYLFDLYEAKARIAVLEEDNERLTEQNDIARKMSDLALQTTEKAVDVEKENGAMKKGIYGSKN